MRHALLIVLCLSTVINYIDRQSLAVVLPALRVDLHLTSADYGLITTLFLTAYTVMQIGAGLLIDRWGTRWGFTAFVALWSLAAMGHAFVSGVAGLAALRFVLGLGEAGNWPAGAKTIAASFPKERRAFAMGVFDGGSALGAILAPPLLAVLTLRYGWRSAFVLTGVLGFLWIVAWLFVGRADTHRAPTRSAWTGLRQVLGVRQLWGLMLTRMFATPVWWFYVFWLPDYLGKERHFSLGEIGQYAWIPYLTVDLGKLVGGALSDRLLAHGWTATLARKAVMASGALCMLGGLFVTAAPEAVQALSWVSLATFGFGLWSANILALHADIFPVELMASAIGWTGAAASLAGAIFTYMVGQMVDQYGYQPVFWAVGSAALVAFAALLVAVGQVRAMPVREAVT